MRIATRLGVVERATAVGERFYVIERVLIRFSNGIVGEAVAGVVDSREGVRSRRGRLRLGWRIGSVAVDAEQHQRGEPFREAHERPRGTVGRPEAAAGAMHLVPGSYTSP